MWSVFGCVAEAAKAGTARNYRCDRCEVYGSGSVCWHCGTHMVETGTPSLRDQNSSYGPPVWSVPETSERLVQRVG